MATAVPCWPQRDSAHLLVSGAQMAALEQQLFASGLPVEALMEKAALAVAEAIQADWGERLHSQGAVVLAGPGHNGGDGLVIARELHLAGIRTRIWSPFERHKPLTEAHLRHAQWLGIERLQQAPDPAGAAVWIDALFGIGQRRRLEQTLAALLLERARQRPGALVAVDVPSGLDDTSGETLGPVCACAAVTYAIGLCKQGLAQDPALPQVGRLRRIDLGLPAPLLQALPAGTPLWLQECDAKTAPWPTLSAIAGKYERGRVLVIAGSARYRGAALLALLGASASGAGSLRAALAAPMAENLWQWLPHAVLQRPLECDASGSLLLGGLQPADLERLDAIVLGPGIGVLDADALSQPEAAAEQRSWLLLQRFPGLLLLDADGLNRSNVSWLQGRVGPTWITPHRGELQHLWPALAQLPALDAAALAASESGAVVLLKGARSVIAAPDGQRWQLAQATPAAARAGLGDVLAGYAAARGAMALAAGQPCQSAWLAAAALDHALAGTHCERRTGPGGCTPAAIATTLAKRPWQSC